jgi:hypothetical protein
MFILEIVFKVFFSTTNGLISIKLSTNYLSVFSGGFRGGPRAPPFSPKIYHLMLRPKIPLFSYFGGGPPFQGFWIRYWVEEIEGCSNKGSGPPQRGDNHKNAKILWVHLKIFSRATRPGKFRST